MTSFTTSLTASAAPWSAVLQVQEL
ncbi:MAG: hypothetical protein QOD01_1116, partial [Actinomycetota bacterium]|nr:hypothetical protein [Actinomycetota bacterium]